MALTQITEKGIKDGEIINADINASAAIAGSKISPDFGSQNIVTTGTSGSSDLTITSAAPTLLFTETNGDPDYKIQANAGVLKLVDTTNSADRVVVSTTGNIGIGLSSNIDRKLHVKSSGLIAKLESTSETSALMFATPNNESASTIPNIGATSSDLTFTTGNLSRLTVKSDGKVGIGQSSPEGLLHLEASSSGASYTADAADTLILERNGGCVIDFRTPAANDSGLLFSDTSRAVGNILYNHSDDTLRFAAGGSERIRIEGGNFKILDGDLVIGAAGHGIDFSDTTNYGTSTPAELLDDYEEGQFEPDFSTPNGQILRHTYRGEYCKIGRVVHCMWSISSNGTSGTTNGTVSITGFPFTAEVPAASGPRGGGGVIYGGYGSPDTLSRSLISGTTLSILLNDGSYLDFSDATNTGGNGFQMSGMITYLTST